MRIELSAIDLSGEAGFLARLGACATTNSGGTAVECAEHVLTWGELYSRACRVANGLAGLGARPGDRIAILAANSTAYVETFMGIVCGGMSAVTLPTMVEPEAVGAMLVDSGARVLFVSSETEGLAAAMASRMREPAGGGLIAYDFERPGWTDYATWLAAANAEAPNAEVAPEAEFNIVYSSGTTGRPKGIVHSHRTRASMAQGFSALGFGRESISLIATPLYTNMSIPVLLATLWSGGRSVVTCGFDANEYLALAETRGVTHFFMVPTMVQRLFQSRAFDATDLSNTRLKYVAGSHLRSEVKRALLSRWPGSLLEVYGLTEGAPATCLFADQRPDKLDSVGQPVAGCEIRIIDDDGRELSAGAVGEIVGRSGSMMRGYNNLPEETEALIWRDAEGNAYFRSGDIGRFDEDGFLYVLDRKKDMIISGGLNIYAADIEPIVAAHPAVAEVAVIAVPSDRWGETPLALVVLSEGMKVAAEEIRDWSNEQLGKHQRISAVEFRDVLPRNALGKVLKRELRAHYWANR